MPVGKFVVRGEVAEYLDELQTGGARAASTNALIGLDWYAGNDWTLSAIWALLLVIALTLAVGFVGIRISAAKMKSGKKLG